MIKTLCEQVILRALNRNCIPEYKPTRPRLAHYPRTAYFKRARITEELQRLIAAAKEEGLSPESVDSIYLKGEDAIAEHERRNGYDKAYGPGGVIQWKEGGKLEDISTVARQVFV
jgi:chorismate mutase